VCIVLPFAPSDFVNLFLNLHTLEIVKLRLVALELSPKLVLTTLFLRDKKNEKDEKKKKERKKRKRRKQVKVLTPSSRSKSTTRPPLSPVARCLPLSSNSTVEIMSAGERERKKRKRKRREEKEEKRKRKENEPCMLDQSMQSEDVRCIALNCDMCAVNDGEWSNEISRHSYLVLFFFSSSFLFLFFCSSSSLLYLR